MPSAARPPSSLRVALVTPGLGHGGLERIVRDLALALQARGHAPRVFCTAKLGVHAEALRASGVQTPLCRGLVPGLAGVVLKLGWALRRFRPQVIHSHGGAWLAASLARSLAGLSAAHLHTEHGRAGLRGWRLRAEAWCAARTHRVAAVTDALARELRRTTGRAVETIPNGVSLASAGAVSDAGLIRAQLGIPRDDILVAAIGRLEPVKDHSLLLRSVALARRAVPRLGAVVLGEGSLRQTLEAEARALGVSQQVRFAGFRPDAGRWLEAADIFALPSRSEGLPLALLEAMAHGLPTVACDLPGVAEALGDPPAGILVDRGDAGGFAEALAQLAGDAPRRRGLGARARLRSREFSLEKMVDRYFALYEERSR